jgi:hypothetical protein
MNIENHLHEVVERLNKVVDIYACSLDQFSVEQLRHKPNEERWSLGQVYNHVIHAALEIYYPAVLTCINKPEQEATVKTAAGIEIFRRGGYPQLKVKTVNLPKNTDDRKSLHDGLNMIVEHALYLLPIVVQSSADAKVNHPRLGALNAQEWFELAEMHMRHHLRQKKELEVDLGIHR